MYSTYCTQYIKEPAGPQITGSMPLIAARSAGLLDLDSDLKHVVNTSGNVHMLRPAAASLASNVLTMREGRPMGRVAFVCSLTSS